MHVMFNNPSMFLRIAYGKTIGFVFAGAGILLFSDWYADITVAQKWGFVLYYTVIGALVGLTGIMTYNPAIKLRMAWWFRGPWIGAWMNFVLMLFIYDDLTALQTEMFGANSTLSSPWWFVVEGAILGLFMDFICTKFAGEGLKTVLDGSLEQP
jgi:hypothetical protein